MVLCPLTFLDYFLHTTGSPCVLLEVELCMGDNDIHAMCTHEQEMVNHVIPELHDKVAARYNEGTIGQSVCQALF